MKRKRHSPEQIIRKLRDADRMLSEGNDVGAVCQALAVSEATSHRWRNQYGGMKAEDARQFRFYTILIPVVSAAFLTLLVVQFLPIPVYTPEQFLFRGFDLGTYTGQARINR